MFSSCTHKQTSSVHKLYTKKSAYAFHPWALGARCAGDHNRAPIFLPLAGAATPIALSTCAKLCDDQADRCNYFHLNDNGSTCAMFTACGTTVEDPTFTIHKRKHMLQIDGVSHYTALTTDVSAVPRTEAMLLFNVQSICFMRMYQGGELHPQIELNRAIMPNLSIDSPKDIIDRSETKVLFVHWLSLLELRTQSSLKYGMALLIAESIHKHCELSHFIPLLRIRMKYIACGIQLGGCHCTLCPFWNLCHSFAFFMFTTRAKTNVPETNHVERW